MPLTKSDLQQIGNVVDERLNKRFIPVEKRLGGIEDRLEPVEKRLGNIEQRLVPVERGLSNIEDRLEPVEKGVKALRRDVRYLKRTVDIIARNYDEGDVLLARRVKRIEDHLSLPSGN